MADLRVAFDATATPEGLTGAGYYVIELLRELSQRDGIDVTVISRRGDKERFEKLGLRVLDVAPTNKVKRIAYQSFRLGQLVDSIGVDVFHGPHYQLPLSMKTPCVVTVHDMTLITHPEVHHGSKKLFFSRVIPRSIKKADAVIAVSNHTAHDISSTYGEVKNLVVAPLAANHDRFNNNTLDTDVDLLKLRGVHIPYIAFLGVLEPRKCIPVLVKAFAHIADDFPEHTLVIAGGDGWGMSDIRESFVESGVRTRIAQTGRLSDEEVPALLRHADVFVYPSLYEGFGLPVLEAMACGAPTITTKSSSLSEVAGDAALLVEPEDVADLARAIRSVLSDTQLAKELSNKGIARAKEFTWSACADAHVGAYKLAVEK
jgi:glycosyltransferase involved in cell wall biosynthesis